MTYLLDASAILAMLKREPGHQRATECYGDGAVSSVNAAEVAIKLQRDGMPAAEVQRTFDDLNLVIIPFDPSWVLPAATIVPVRGNGLSLGDRACLATARALKLTAVTTDSAWARFMSDELRIEVIR